MIFKKSSTQVNRFLNFIHDFIDELIEWNVLGWKYPKSKRLFSKTRKQVERLSEILYRLLVEISLQFVMLPKFIVSFGIYFFTDLKNDSFYKMFDQLMKYICIFRLL